MRFIVALLAVAFVALAAFVAYLFIHESLTDKMAHKGFVLQSLPLLGGIVLLLFCLPLLVNVVRLLVARAATAQ
jgi:hypothetical protein